jgi:tetratricopeptide (TPR) repeat protein
MSGAELKYISAVKLQKRHFLANERLGRIYMRYHETTEKALAFFCTCVEERPRNHGCWYLLGRCLASSGKRMDALEAYHQAVSLEPTHSPTWCSLGNIYYAHGQYREAINMYTLALKYDAVMAEAWYNIGVLYEMVGQSPDALSAYRYAIDLGAKELLSSMSDKQVGPIGNAAVVLTAPLHPNETTKKKPQRSLQAQEQLNSTATSSSAPSPSH